jgi:hypothetical protein
MSYFTFEFIFVGIMENDIIVLHRAESVDSHN